MKEYNRREERTGIQESHDFGSNFDVQSDFVMVYGFHNLKERIEKWKEKGYVIHLMTGVSWGGYEEYLSGAYDGMEHYDEIQNSGTEEIRHDPRTPYMVPSNAYAHFLANGLKYAVDCGVEAIHLEEPEFWINGGYSESFKREWQIYYKEPWQDPKSSCDAQYRASKLKQYLYTRTLDRLCSELKEYAMVKYNLFLRFYVPTHSLINYSHWGIISPESALLDLPTIDGYIAQIWTGTSRTPNIYRGIRKERTFETAFLEYGIMQELVRGTGRKMWFLADPIEDNPNLSWKDYRENYYRTLVASLLHPEISNYEVSPWPYRVMNGTHLLNDKNDTKTIIPPKYKTNLVSVMHTLRDMADQTNYEYLTDTTNVGILMADSSMFQRYSPATGTCPSNEFSHFFGLALPLVKAGIFARPIQLDNVRRFAGYLDSYHTLVLSYEYMKPSSPDIHQALAGWVKNGGQLIYVGDGTDPFHQVREWWNTGKNHFQTPAEHLFEVLGIKNESAIKQSKSFSEKIYTVGNGKVMLLSYSPDKIAEDANLSDFYVQKVLKLTHTKSTQKLLLRRGAYYVTAIMDEGNKNTNKHTNKHTLEGTFIDLFDDKLSVITNPLLTEGTVNLFYDVKRIEKSKGSEIIALSGRASDIKQEDKSLTFTVSSPSEMVVACRIWSKHKPNAVLISNKQLAYQYDVISETTYFTYPSNGEAVKIVIHF